MNAVNDKFAENLAKPCQKADQPLRSPKWAVAATATSGRAEEMRDSHRTRVGKATSRRYSVWGSVTRRFRCATCSIVGSQSQNLHPIESITYDKKDRLPQTCALP